MAAAGRRLAAVVGVMVVLTATAAPRAQDWEVAAAGQAADTWLALVDARNYAASWDLAATFFKDNVTPEQWAVSAGEARRPLGAMRLREIRAARRVSTLPGVPDGDYVVFQFDTIFAGKAAAVETVTFVREDDGLWRAVGYFVR